MGCGRCRGEALGRPNGALGEILMAVTITQVTVFVSSPSDMVEEREISVEVCNELNLDRGRREGFVVNPLLWETHSRPAAGPSPQDRVFLDLGESYDIFVGFIGHRFGTPTRNAGSGTEEEYDRAYARYSKGESVEIMFYFRDPQTAPGKISARDLLKVEEFREKISSRGVKYGTYASSDEFKTLLYRHLSSAVSSVLNQSGGQSTSVGSQEVDPLKNLNSLEVLEDDGLEDLVADATENFEIFGEAAAEIGAAVEKLAGHFNELTAEISATANMDSQARQTIGRRLIERTSHHMESYTKRVVAELPSMHESMSSGLDSIRRAVVIANEDGVSSDADKAELLDSLATLRPIIAGGVSNIEAFSGAISSFPRLSSPMNRAKRRMQAANNDIIEFFQRCITQIDSLLKELE
jgi:hypothetical protein